MILALSGAKRGALRAWRWFAAGLVVATLCAMGLWARPRPEQLYEVFSDSGSYSSLLFVAAGVSLISAFVPKTVVSVSAGAIFGTLWGSLLMVVVASAAAALNYVVAAVVAARWIDQERLAVWATAHPQLDAVRRATRDGGFRLQLLLRLAPVPTMLISYACGAVGARFGPYMAATASAVLGQVLWVHSGSIAGATMAGDGGAVGWVSLSVTVAASIGLGIYLKRYAERELSRQ